MKKIILLLCSVLIFFTPQTASAREEISDMNVVVEVRQDSSIKVTERIAFVAEGLEIRRGLIRNIPVIANENGRDVKGDFAMISAMLDGKPVHYELRREGRNVEIYLGDDSFLSRGKHTYELAYTLTRQLTFHNDADELYWNVTGNDWIFPISRAAFQVVLPAGANMTEHDASTGSYGSREKGWKLGSDGVFRATQELRPGKGFTVSVVWPKGFVTPPPKPWLETMLEVAGRPLVVFNAFIIIAWYFGCWFFFGRDPKPGTIYPTFSPPRGFEPAYTGYIKNLKFDADLLLADLIDLAVKGFVILAPETNSLKVGKTDKTPDESISATHKALLEKLFMNNEATVYLGNGSMIVRNQSVSSFTKSVLLTSKSSYCSDRPVLIHHNKVLGFIGLLFLIPLIWLISEVSPEILAEAFLAALPMFFITLYLRGIWMKLKSVRNAYKDRKGRDPSIVKILLAFVPAVFLLIMAFTLLPVTLSTGKMFWAFWNKDPVVVGSLLLAAAAVALFSKLMPSRTETGRKYLDEVEGFEMYLKTAERHRLEVLYPAGAQNIPAMTDELFERFLPYAFALGVAETWVNSFANLLGANDYHPAWYHSSTPFSISNFNSRIRSMSNSMHPRSSSSGSSGRSGRGGGSFSGGGHGGGGGRGR